MLVIKLAACDEQHICVCVRVGSRVCLLVDCCAMMSHTTVRGREEQFCDELKIIVVYFVCYIHVIRTVVCACEQNT